MGLQEILSISGKGGLFKLVGTMKNGVIVESLIDGKKTPAHAHNRISALSDISIYGDDGEKPLAEIMKAIVIKFNAEPIAFKKWSGAELKSEFMEIFPGYDEDRVYVSDIKKVYQWTNLLLDKKVIDLDWANAKEETEAAKEESAE
ncbi:MAG: DUF5606 domain-containing protein [Salibacteraceae bacterium]